MIVKVRYTVMSTGEMEIEVPADFASEAITTEADAKIRNHANATTDAMVAFSWNAEDTRFGGRTY
jgi:hypothetical protein